MRHYLIVAISLVLLNGCYKVGYGDFLDFRNEGIGKKPYFTQPFRFKDAGELRRGDFLITGQGFTHITKNEGGDLIYHWDSGEVLPNFNGNKAWIGKCKYYYIIDAKTGLVKSWGFDKGGNPLSCRTWS